MPRTLTTSGILRGGPDASPSASRPVARLRACAGRPPPARPSVQRDGAAHEPLRARAETSRVFTDNRRLRDELRLTHARIAVLEAERNEYLRKDRRAGVLTHDAFREAAAAALRASQRRGEPAAAVLVDIDGFRALN